MWPRKSVDVMDMMILQCMYIQTLFVAHTHTHVLFLNCLTCSRWLQHSEEMHKRNTHFITHLSDNNRTHTRTQTPHCSYVCPPATHTYLRLQTAAGTHKNSMDSSTVQHNSGADNPLIVLRKFSRHELFERSRRDHSNHSVKKSYIKEDNKNNLQTMNFSENVHVLKRLKSLIILILQSLRYVFT